MKNARVLIVEDEAIVARDLRMRLTRLGYTVVETTGRGETALEMVERLQPQIVLMDICLQGEMDGVQAAEIIRSRFQLPVVFVTAHADEATLERACVTEPFGYILKPFEERDLLTSIEMALYKHQTEQRLRETETQLRQSQKMEAIGRLAGGIAHDFNNLLTVINGYASLLLEALKPEAQCHEYVQEISRAGARAADLVQQLLTFSRRQPRVTQSSDVNDVLVATERLLRRLIGEHIEIRLVLAANLDRIAADPQNLERVLINLAANARDAMPKGGVLTLETARTGLPTKLRAVHEEALPGDYCLIRAMDTGCGMDEVTLSHLFEPFFTTKEVGKGTGLGLSTVYGIIRQYGGYIVVESVVGKGTTFDLYLPMTNPSVEPVPRIDDRAALPTGKETVLFVEDETAVRRLGCEILTQCGYTVLEAADGADALDLCRRSEGHIDLIVTDVIMPRLGGGALLDQIHQLQPGVKMLCVSGHSPGLLMPQGIDEKSRLFLPKPYSPSLLAERVRELLDAEKADEET